MATARHLTEIIQSGQMPTGYKIENWKQMEGWFRTYLDYQASVDYECSCPFGTIGNDLGADERATRKVVTAFLDWGRIELATFFARKIEAGELPKSADARGLADLCVATMQGGMLLTKIRHHPDMFASAASEVLKYVKQLRAAAKKKC